MNLRRTLLLLALAMTGYGALAYLFPRVHPAAKWGQQIDRPRAVELARVVAQREGMDADGWTAGVESSVQTNSDYYLIRGPNPGIAPLLSPTLSLVTLNDAGGSRRIQVSIANDGRIIGWERTEPRAKDAVSLAVAEAKSKAETALLQLAGSARSSFVIESENTGGTSSSRFSWQMTVAGEARVRLRAVIEIENGIISKVSLNPVFSNEYLDTIRAERRVLNALSIAGPIVLLLGLLVGLVYYLLNIVRKEVSYRSTLVLFAALFFVITAWNLNSNLFDEIYLGISRAPQLQRYYLSAVLTGLIISLLTLLFVLPLLVAWGAGYPLSARQRPNPLRGIEILLRGHLRARVTGARVMTGLAVGWIIPVLTLAISASGMFRETQIRSLDTLAETLSSRAPIVTGPADPTILGAYVVALLYVFLVPLAVSHIRRPLLVRLVAVLVGATCLTGTSSFQSSTLASSICSLAVMLVLDQLTHRVDVLAALVALLAGDYAIKFTMLLVQPALALQSSGLRGWALLLLALVVAGYVALRGRELSESEANPVWTSDEQRPNRADRERLKAEFDVARRAQQQMLPEQTPTFPGFEIAAVCRPAREVGGDLYDFIELTDDRLGIVVADVSGKGVPAALYMTLTKGLLASVAEASSDPGEILREVNRHLYVACGKKMFVTVLLGVVDPSRRTFSYARAGHNPPVWRRAEDNETTLLRARGLGLGLNSGDVFNRALTVETIQLEVRDKLILYSDGITEAMNEGRIEYGEERLMALAARSDGLNAEQMRDAIVADVSAFLGPTHPQDDQTLVIVRVC